MKNWYQIITHMKNWYLFVTDVSDKTVNELKSNDKCSRFEGYFINVRNMHVCYIKFDFMRVFHKVGDIGTKYVTYWYQFFTCCEKLVPILHSVKFTKCEICGSTMLCPYATFFGQFSS